MDLIFVSLLNRILFLKRPVSRVECTSFFLSSFFSYTHTCIIIILCFFLGGGGICIWPTYSFTCITHYGHYLICKKILNTFSRGMKLTCLFCLCIFGKTFVYKSESVLLNLSDGRVRKEMQARNLPTKKVTKTRQV